MVLGGFWEDFGRFLGRFWMDFGKIWEERPTMIRATMGTSRSTNHWKGSWMVRRDPKKLDLRWVAVISMALLNELFFEGNFFHYFSVFVGFWEVLGSQLGGENRFLRNFFRSFFRGQCWHRFLIVFRKLET